MLALLGSPASSRLVYTDMNHTELDRLPRHVEVPGPEHVPATALTARYMTRLVSGRGRLPRAGPAPTAASRSMWWKGWLPPATGGAEGEPAYRGRASSRPWPRGPVRHVHGQHHPRSRESARPLAGSNSGEDLHALGGGPPRGVDSSSRSRLQGGTRIGIFGLPAPDRVHAAAERQPAEGDLPAGADAIGVRRRPGRRAGRGAQLRSGAARPVRLVDQQTGPTRSASCTAGHDRADRSRGGGGLYPGNSGS